MSKELQFKWSWCGSCDAPYVICPKCKNGCCNGTATCDICSLAYQYQKNCPKPTRESFGDIPDKKVAENEKLWKEMGFK